ncbi:hypothetical protein Tco_0608402 [Tanacetum coccineum]
MEDSCFGSRGTYGIEYHQLDDLYNQPLVSHNSLLSQEDLEQINPDDLEEMDLYGRLAMPDIRARRFSKRTSRKWIAPRNQENREREINRRTIIVETPTKNALVAQDGIEGTFLPDQDSEIRILVLNSCFPPFIGNVYTAQPDLTFIDEIVESENMDVTTIVTPSNVKTVESNYKFAGVKRNSDAVEPKTLRNNSFRPLVIED